MPTKTLTENFLKRIKPVETETYFWDTKSPGLGVRVNRQGHAYFVVGYRVKGTGKRRRVSLGRYGALTLEQARIRSREYVSAGLAGDDLQDQHHTRNQGITFDELAEQWLTLHVRPKRAEKTLGEYEKILRLYLSPAFGDRPAEVITRTDVSRLHSDMADRPRAANYAIATGKALFNFGITTNLITGSNPFSKIELYRQKKRERFLSPDEMTRLGDALSQLVEHGRVTLHTAAAIKMLALTGARKMEILSLQWRWVDFDKKALFLPTSKTGERRIELSRPALQVLKSLPRLPDNPHVFVGQKPGCHLVNIQKAWQLVCKTAEIEPCRVHDLRHSYASFLAAGGQTLLVIGKLLGHTLPSTTQRYSHLTEDAVRRANDALGDEIGELLEGDH